MMMRKAFVSAAGVFAVLMAVSLTFLIPSGAVTEEAQQRYLDAAYEAEESWDEASLPKPDAVLASAGFRHQGCFAHIFGKQSLPKGVIDLVRARV